MNPWFIFIGSLFSYSKNRVSLIVSLVSSAIDWDKVTSVEMIHVKHVDGLLYVLKNTGDDNDGSEDDREKGGEEGE